MLSSGECRQSRYSPGSGGIEHGSDLSQAGLGEVPVVVAFERVHQRGALNAQQICQRMLIDHGAMLEASAEHDYAISLTHLDSARATCVLAYASQRTAQ